ncbi:uncharacterized protein LOC110983374 [Acanthaster planci]|uniref:Uncharacterized protein LOC110983374 n=1 Tax=Acanthaster planci TaxID=133434 RepID=A0A8B7Z000_ACAPL|nr:uncharacterized protein LOC110983374 [Acanthaster planci]
MSFTEQIQSMMPELINGKTHKQLEEELVAIHKMAGIHVVDGVKFPFHVLKSNLEALRTFEVRDDDVFVVTYPRSGTHWVSEILKYILQDGRGDFDRTFISTGLELTRTDDPKDIESATPGYKIYSAMKSPRLMVSHCLERFLPPQVLTKHPKVVYVARNPKDVLVSWYKLASFGNFSELLWAFCLSKIPFGGWFDHVLSYWNRRDDDNFLFVKYEDLHKDLRGSIYKLAKHVGKDLPHDVIDAIMERVTFDAMQRTYQQLEEEGGKEGELMVRYKGRPIIRKGQVGDWKNNFTVADSALFDKIYALGMEGTGLDFDFEYDFGFITGGHNTVLAAPHTFDPTAPRSQAAVMSFGEQIQAMMPDLINGKTHQQLEEELVAREKMMGNHVVDGVKLPFQAVKSNLEALQTFEVRDDDVFVVTYPRSGTHWVSEILQYILQDGRGDFDRTFITTGLEFTRAEEPKNIESTTPGYKIYAAMKSPRLMISHCLEQFLPPQVLTKQPKVVYVARNPKDTLVSLSKMVPFWNFSELLWAFCPGKTTFGSWFDHVLSYWKRRDDRNFLFVKYEDFHKDLRGSICKLAKHVGKDLPDDVIDCITERVTFNAMQRTYQQLEDEGGKEGKLLASYKGRKFIRKGQVGDWKNTFTVAESALFDKIYALRMKGTGLDFDFEL